MVWRQLKWLLPLVFCRSDPDASRWDLDAVTSECCSAIVGLTNGSGLVARVNQRNGLPGMRSRTGEVRPISRGLRSDLFRSRMPFSSEKPLSQGLFTRRHPVQTCAMAMSKGSWEPPSYSKGNKPPPSCFLSAMSGGAGRLCRSRSL